MIENIVIRGSAWVEDDLHTLFGDEEVTFADSTELSALMKELEIFPSTSAARRAGRVGPVPAGLTEFKASKKRVIWIWNPEE